MIKTIEERGRKWLALVLQLTAFLPLVYIPYLFVPFITGKVFIFRTLVTVALLLYFFLLSRKRVEFYRDIFSNKTAFLPGAILFLGMISAFFGIDPYHSFWSSFGRMDGVLSLIYITAFFYLIVLVFTKNEWERFFKFISWAAGGVALIALLQAIGLPGVVHSGVDRAEGTIGNAAFLAGYLGLSFFITLREYFKEDNKSKSFYGILAITQALAVFASETRGTLLALGFVFLVTLGYLSIKNNRGVWQKRARLGLIAAFILGSFFFVFKEDLADNRFSLVRRLATTDLSNSTAKSRLFIWRETLKEIPARPIFGVGMENFEYLYNNFYDPSAINEEWFDRSHNSFVDKLAEGGAVGFLAHTALVFSFILLAYRSFRKDSRFWPLLLLAGVYIIQSLFVFDTFVSQTYLLMLVVLAFLLTERKEKGCFVSIPLPAFYLIGFFLIASLWWTVIQPFRANVLLATGYHYQIVDVDRSVRDFKKGWSLGTFADLEYGYQAYRVFTNQIEYKTNGGNFSDDEMQKSYDYGYFVLKTLIDRYPWNPRPMVYLGHLIDSNPRAAFTEGEYQIALMDRAIALSPKRSQPYYLKANVYIRRAGIAPIESEKEKNYELATNILEAYAKEVPNLAETNFILANLYINIGETKKAEVAYQRGAGVYNIDEKSAGRAAGYLIRQKRFSEAEQYLRDLVFVSPHVPAYQVDLVRALYLNNKFDEAKTILGTIQKNFPDALKNEQDLINTVTNN